MKGRETKYNEPSFDYFDYFQFFLAWVENVTRRPHICKKNIRETLILTLLMCITLFSGVFPGKSCTIERQYLKRSYLSPLGPLGNG